MKKKSLEERVKEDLRRQIASQDVEEIKNAQYVSVLILGARRAKKVLKEMVAQAQQKMANEEYVKLNAQMRQMSMK